MGRMKTVIHIHTSYSFDSNTSAADLIETAQRQGVTCIAVTDHDEIAGALEVRAIAPPNIQVIVGEEISTADGHLIGLFLQHRIPPGLTVEETARRIRAQGGLVLAPHPCASLCEDSLDKSALLRILPWLDAIEVCNAQNVLFWEDLRVQRFARRHGLATYAGADTHIRGYLDACYQVLPEFDGPAGFRAALQRAELHAGRFGPGYFALMGVRHVWDKLAPAPLRGFGVNAPDQAQPSLAH